MGAGRFSCVVTAMSIAQKRVKCGQKKKHPFEHKKKTTSKNMNGKKQK
jgi:hypothetical protein